MPRPRFHRLDPQRRDQILDAAAGEFGEHGFERASYNKIIERAGLSKGAMYYYFDDKLDLYTTVVDQAMDELLTAFGELPQVRSASAFWAEVEGVYHRAVTVMLRSPRVAALTRTFLSSRYSAGSASLAKVDARARAWMAGVLDRGRDVGAIRTDLPADLLVAVTMGMGEAMDVWLVNAWAQAQDKGSEIEVEQMVPTLLGLIRRVLDP